VRVAGALPGEDVEAEVNHVSTHRPVAWASLTTIRRASPARVAPACPAHGRCGGCVLQHLAYPAQVAWKEARLQRLVADCPALAGAAVTAAVPSPRPLGYRSTSKLVAGRDAGGRLILGAYAPRTHHLVDLAGCRIVEPVLDEVAGALSALLVDRNLAPYDERRLVGILRYVVLRASARGEVLATLVTAGDSLPGGAALAEALRAARPEVVGVVQNVNPARGNVVFGDRERTLAGAPFLEEEIVGLRLRLSSRAFFQANRQVAAAAYAAIAAAAALTGAETVVDAYAGAGGIALTLAPRARAVLGIEVNAAAVADASSSALAAGITNTRFVAGDVAAHLATAGAADIVVLNPPRKGCSPSVLHAAAALGPRTIAYLSCAPDTLVVDLETLARLGYRTTTITPFDMLPHTPHVEALAILERHTPDAL
jgi:23S rRNA (uracil1939-C5)-methyltransferase